MENSFLIKCTELLDGRLAIRVGHEKVLSINAQTAINDFINSCFVGKKIEPVIDQIKESQTITTCKVMYYSKNDKLAEELLGIPKPFLVYLITCRNEAIKCQV
jgi:hypothetical protein